MRSPSPQGGGIPLSSPFKSRRPQEHASISLYAIALPSSRWAADGGHMTYILNRLLSIALTLFLISVITFAVTTILPGDVAMMIMGTQSNPDALAGLRKSRGLYEPPLV